MQKKGILTEKVENWYYWMSRKNSEIEMKICDKRLKF